MWLNNVRAFPSYMKGVVHERLEAMCVSHRLLREELEHERELHDKAVKEVAVLRRNLMWFDKQLRLQELDTRETP